MSQTKPTQQTKKRPTLKTIAKQSGLALTTVSRALSDAPDISEKTKEKVRKIADDLGYHRDRAALRLRTGRTHVISMVLGVEPDGLSMTTRLISSVAGALRGTPYHLIVTPTLPDEDPLAPIRYIVESQSADAIILNQTLFNDPRVAYLQDKGFPFVTHGRTQWADEHAWIDYDNRAFGAQSVQGLIDRGRNRIVLIAPPQNQFYGREMFIGARDQATRSGVTFELAQDVTSDSDKHLVAHWISDVISAQNAPDGLIVASPIAAIAALNAIEQSDLLIGQDIDVFAKETVPLLSFLKPEIHGIFENVETAGIELAKAATKIAEDSSAMTQWLSVT